MKCFNSDNMYDLNSQHLLDFFEVNRQLLMIDSNGDAGGLEYFF